LSKFHVVFYVLLNCIPVCYGNSFEIVTLNSGKNILNNLNQIILLLSTSIGCILKTIKEAKEDYLKTQVNILKEKYSLPDSKENKLKTLINTSKAIGDKGILNYY